MVALHLTEKTPRPWAHVMAEPRRVSARWCRTRVRVHSYMANERQNALTPFRFESTATAAVPGQLIYVVDLATGEASIPPASYPSGRSDARYDVTYDLGSPRPSACGEETWSLS